MRRTIDFLQLTSKLPYPPTVKGKLSTVHATLIDQFLPTFQNKHTEKLQIVHAINCVSYMYTSSDSKPYGWNEADPLHTYVDRDDDELVDVLGDLYISTKDIDWTNVPVASENDSESVPVTTSESVAQSRVVDVPPVPTFKKPVSSVVVPTDKSDLYIQPPTVPRFDYAHPWKSGMIDGEPYVIYPSYPIVPTKQNEISSTTDVNKMSDSDLKRLYPNCLIRTRATCMYEPCGKLVLDSKLGLILPIKGYTKKQLVDNLVKYPHIFRLLKQVDGNLDSFYSTIEIDGELHKISDVWSTLPESKDIPYTKEFVKEYVVRRYLLERDIKGIDHKYKLYGTLDPYLTLFTSMDDYISMGYNDIIQMAKDCVQSRVRYKQSRNPIIRRLDNV